MLVISRRIGESFLIGDDIEATVVDITGDSVVLGVTAPKSVPIERLGMPQKHKGKQGKAKPSK
jgi:carbon storage regulator